MFWFGTLVNCLYRGYPKLTLNRDPGIFVVTEDTVCGNSGAVVYLFSNLSNNSDTKHDWLYPICTDTNVNVSDAAYDTLGQNLFVTLTSNLNLYIYLISLRTTIGSLIYTTPRLLTGPSLIGVQNGSPIALLQNGLVDLVDWTFSGNRTTLKSNQNEAVLGLEGTDKSLFIAGTSGSRSFLKKYNDSTHYKILYWNGQLQEKPLVRCQSLIYLLFQTQGMIGVSVVDSVQFTVLHTNLTLLSRGNQVWTSCGPDQSLIFWTNDGTGIAVVSPELVVNYNSLQGSQIKLIRMAEVYNGHLAVLKGNLDNTWYLDSNTTLVSSLGGSKSASNDSTGSGVSGVLVGIIVCALVFAGILGVSLFLLFRPKDKRDSEAPEPRMLSAFGDSLMQFSPSSKISHSTRPSSIAQTPDRFKQHSIDESEPSFTSVADKKGELTPSNSSNSGKSNILPQNIISVSEKREPVIGHNRMSSIHVERGYTQPKRALSMPVSGIESSALGLTFMEKPQSPVRRDAETDMQVEFEIQQETKMEQQSILERSFAAIDLLTDVSKWQAKVSSMQRLTKSLPSVDPQSERFKNVANVNLVSESQEEPKRPEKSLLREISRFLDRNLLRESTLLDRDLPPVLVDKLSHSIAPEETSVIEMEPKRPEKSSKRLEQSSRRQLHTPKKIQFDYYGFQNK